MATSIMSMTPLIPGDSALAQSPLPDKAIQLLTLSSRLAGMKESLKDSATLVLNAACIHGEISRSEALELCAMPERSARRLLGQMKEEGLLSETSSKSPLRWEIPEHAEKWYFPALSPAV